MEQRRWLYGRSIVIAEMPEDRSLTSEDLGERSVLNAFTVRNMLSTLESAGLVQSRYRDERKEWGLTEDGLRLSRSLKRVVEELERLGEVPGYREKRGE